MPAKPPEASATPAAMTSSHGTGLPGRCGAVPPKPACDWSRHCGIVKSTNTSGANSPPGAAPVSRNVISLPASSRAVLSLVLMADLPGRSASLPERREIRPSHCDVRSVTSTTFTVSAIGVLAAALLVMLIMRDTKAAPESEPAAVPAKSRTPNSSPDRGREGAGCPSLIPDLVLEVLGVLGAGGGQPPGDVLAGPQVVAGGVVTQYLAGHSHLVYLGRPVGDAQDAGRHDHLVERHLVARAERAVDLQRPQRDVVQHAGHQHLDRGDVLAHLAVVVVLVDRPRGVQDEQPELGELSVGVRDVALDELLVGQQAALR